MLLQFTIEDILAPLSYRVHVLFHCPMFHPDLINRLTDGGKGEDDKVKPDELK